MLVIGPPAPRSTLFPYTTLFRSRRPEREEESRRGFGRVFRRRTWACVDAHSSCPALHGAGAAAICARSEEYTSELQSLTKLVCRLLLEKKKRQCSGGQRLTGRPR